MEGGKREQRGFSWYVWPSWWLPLKLLVAAWLIYGAVVTFRDETGPQLAATWTAFAGNGLSGAAVVVLLVGSPLVLTVAWLLAAPTWAYVVQLAMIGATWQSDGAFGTRLWKTVAIIVIGAIASRLLSVLFAFAISFITGRGCGPPPIYCG